MAKIKVSVDDLSLASTYSCIQKFEEGTGALINRYTTSATKDVKSVTFAFELPSASKVRRATVYATLSNSAFAAAVCTINGMRCSYKTTAAVPVEIEEGATSITVPFVFRIMPVLHTNHGLVEKTNHRSEVTFSDVYLLIETVDNCILHAENGELVPYQLYHAEGGILVPYQFQRAVDGALVPYGG